MNINIHIEGATPAILSALSRVIGAKATVKAESQANNTERKHKWSRKAKQNLKLRTPEAPYGLKKDGTPRAKPGAPKKSGATQ